MILLAKPLHLVDVFPKTEQFFKAFVKKLLFIPCFYTLAGSSDKEKALKSFAKLVSTTLRILNFDGQMFAIPDIKNLFNFMFFLLLVLTEFGAHGTVQKSKSTVG